MPEQDPILHDRIAHYFSKPTTTFDEAATLGTNDTVTVPKYGEGKVVAVSGEKVEIVLPDSSTKTFLEKYVTKKTQ